MKPNLARLAAALLATAAVLAGASCRTRGDSSPSPGPKARAHYLANAGVLIVSDETRIVFDPLFRSDFGTYRLLPEELDESTTVVHLGDADTSDVHFVHDALYWERRPLDMAFPPYWYFQSEEGRRVLEERLKPGHAVGIHVPVEMTNPAGRSPELAEYDLFVTPGETRDIP